MMLPSDIVLVQDKKFKKYVQMYAKDQVRIGLGVISIRPGSGCTRGIRRPRGCTHYARTRAAPQCTPSHVATRFAAETDLTAMRDAAESLLCRLRRRVPDARGARHQGTHDGGRLMPGAHDTVYPPNTIYSPNEASNVRAVGTSAGSREPRTRDRPAAAAAAAATARRSLAPPRTPHAARPRTGGGLDTISITIL